MATFGDEVEYEVVYKLKINGSQSLGLEGLMEKEEILPPFLHFQKTATNLEVGSNLPIYPSVPSDWYYGPQIWSQFRSMTGKMWMSRLRVFIGNCPTYNPLSLGVNAGLAKGMLDEPPP